MDAAVAAVISAVDGILTLKEEQGTEQEAFCVEKMFSLYSHLALVMVKHCADRAHKGQ